MAFVDKIDEIREGIKRPAVLGPVDILPFPTDPTYEIPKSTRVTATRGADVFMVTRVIIHWPPGCSSLVDVNVSFQGEPLVPGLINEWVSKDDVTIAYDVNKTVNKRGEFRVVWRNRDTEYPHKVSVDILYIGRRYIVRRESGK